MSRLRFKGVVTGDITLNKVGAVIEKTGVETHQVVRENLFMVQNKEELKTSPIGDVLGEMLLEFDSEAVADAAVAKIMGGVVTVDTGHTTFVEGFQITDTEDGNRIVSFSAISSVRYESDGTTDISGHITLSTTDPVHKAIGRNTRELKIATNAAQVVALKLALIGA